MNKALLAAIAVLTILLIGAGLHARAVTAERDTAAAATSVAQEAARVSAATATGLAEAIQAREARVQEADARMKEIRSALQEIRKEYHAKREAPTGCTPSTGDPAAPGSLARAQRGYAAGLQHLPGSPGGTAP